MKKNKLLKQNIKQYKYKYLFLLVIVLLGFLSGIVFSNILSYNDKKEVGEVVETYFLNLKNDEKINYFNNFLTTLGTNYLYLVLIFIFGISIIGLLLNPFLLYFKSFIIGFSVGIIITLYSFSGIPLSIFYIFPHQILNMIIYVLMSFYGMNLSLKLFKSLFLKKSFSHSEFMRKYLKVFFISVGVILFSTIYETFLADFILKIFTFLIK